MKGSPNFQLIKLWIHNYISYLRCELSFLIYINTYQDPKRNDFLIWTIESLWNRPYFLSTSRLPPLLLLRLPKNTLRISAKLQIGALPGFCSFTDYSKSHQLGSNKPLRLQSAGYSTPAFLLCVQTNPFLQCRNQERACCGARAQHCILPSGTVCHTCHPAGSGPAALEQGQAPTAALPSLRSWAAGAAPSPRSCQLCASSELCVWLCLHHPKTLKTFLIKLKLHFT